MSENIGQTRIQQENVKSLFLVSSAIHTRFGVYDTRKRVEQTIDTCNSIRERCDAEIILLDGGEKLVSEEDRHCLSGHVDRVYDFSGEYTVKNIQKSNSWDVVKNMIEIVMYGSFFDLMIAGKVKLPTYRRIFKLSGRYILNNDFNYDMHMNARGMIVIRGPFASQFKPEITGGVSLQYMSRLWSFDARLLPYIRDKYVEMFKHMNDRLRHGGYIDIEHLLFYHLDKGMIQNPKTIGVEGNIAPNGMRVSD